MLFEILFGFMLLVTLFSCILVFYSLRRISILENVIVEFQQVIEYSSNKLKKIDSTGHFESDDEVGFFFEEVKSIQSILNGIFEQPGQTGENINGESENKSQKKEG